MLVACLLHVSGGVVAPCHRGQLSMVTPILLMLKVWCKLFTLALSVKANFLSCTFCGLFVVELWTPCWKTLRKEELVLMFCELEPLFMITCWAWQFCIKVKSDSICFSSILEEFGGIFTCKSRRNHILWSWKYFFEPNCKVPICISGPSCRNLRGLSEFYFVVNVSHFCLAYALIWALLISLNFNVLCLSMAV